MNRISIPLLLVALLSGCAAQRADVPVSFLGDPIPASEAEKTIEINPDTKWVNVDGGETYRFVIGDKAFGWSFNAQFGPSSFDLQRVAPPGMLNRPVTAYVKPDPKYNRGDGLGILSR
jgi:hypothetical protein